MARVSSGCGTSCATAGRTARGCGSRTGRARDAAAGDVRVCAVGPEAAALAPGARPTLGIKPLYFAWTDHERVFASEIKAMIHRSLRAAIETDRTIPILTHWFESSVPGLYFVGLTSLRAFGPLYRFLAGCGAAAQRVASAIARGWRGRSRAVSAGMPMAAGS